MIRILSHIVIVFVLTVVTQLGGLAWLIALCFKRRVLSFLAIYIVLSGVALWAAPMFGREPLPCFEGGGIQMQSKLFCVFNRHYVVPELKEVLVDLSAKVRSEYPETSTLVLDANFPFLTGFPLLPHLSHNDGRKVDLAFYYRDSEGYLPKVTRSWIGYFAFESGKTDCPNNFLTLRWNLDWLQQLWPNYQLEPERTKAALRHLISDDRVGKILIEPHLKLALGVRSSKVRFQGCRAARHDDHIHLQL